MATVTQTKPRRRKVHYSGFDDLLADAERLATAPVRLAGNWTPGQIYWHLGEAMHASIDGFPFTPSLPLRLIGRVFRPLLLRVSAPPGYKLPAAGAPLLPPAKTNAEGLEYLRAAVARLRTEKKRVPSPVVGTLSIPQWEQLHCRHAEMHMSHIVPE
ncbi:MAG: DUF1569 domain-containing protein [Pirellulales bacterium]|nr:DUF1569 domain-containing protein [Pirellulales bacterium]